MIKKEFKPRDVERMRNLISGKAQERTQIQAGWEKSTEVHKEGEVWEDNGRTWTIKNGLKQTVRKYDEFKNIINLPLMCPACIKPMGNTELNKKMYLIHRKCFECVIKIETELKTKGQFEEYEAALIAQNKQGVIKDLEQVLEEWYQEKTTFVTEDGAVEDWGGGTTNKKLYDKVKEDIKNQKEL